MANLSVPTEVNENIKNETHVSVDIKAAETDTEFDKTHPRLRILHRVPPQMHENNNDVYSPAILSLGPYHRNPQSKQFLQVEELKNEIVSNTLDPTTRVFFYGKILERVDEIRIFYEGLAIDEYDNQALAEMMLRDACFVLHYMKLEIGSDYEEICLVSHLGLPKVNLLDRDFYMLENQIPWWIIKLLITLKFDDKDEEEAFLCKFLVSANFDERQKLARLPWEREEDEPLHLLEALLKAFILKEDANSTVQHRGRIINLIKRRRKRNTYSTQCSTDFEMVNSLFLSVTDLKAKGVHFGPSSYCLVDIKFNSYPLYGKLLLPIWFVHDNTKAFFSNIIAFETSPGGINTSGAMLSYVIFMKSLLETSKDVEVLREKGILFSSLDDKEVLQVFKEIDTNYINYHRMFDNVRMEINKHCDNKAKTWMAELMHTYFRSPWTAITLFAATFLLCLTFLQTYYTMNPVKNN